ncbi:Zinc phosphodiesterase ELAC protein 2 [Entophlyctis luteolus]|nr:Zinc phosphodiesterase ELAC protein 2 [Entophlyctis luteolus]
MKYSLQVLGAATVDARPSVALVFDSQRYLFNCSEGIQRFINDRSRATAAVSPGKTRCIFATRAAWLCIGGLPGLVLTLADAGGKGCVIRGPQGMSHAFAAMRHFVYRPNLPVAVLEYRDDDASPEVYSDENLTVTPVLLAPTSDTPSARRSSHDSAVLNSNGKRTVAADHNKSLEKEQLILSHMFAPANFESQSRKRTKKSSETLTDKVSRSTDGRAARLDVKRMDPCSKSTTVVAYVCQGPRVLGKFNVAAAKELGVPSGPLYGKLSRGESITLPDGRVIEPAQCVGAHKPGAVFFIVDCPSIEYIPAITSHSLLKADKYASSPVQCIVHLLDRSVLHHPTYKEWMNSFDKDCQHIVSCIEHCPQEIVLRSTAKIQHKLNMAASEVFPIPYYQETPDESLVSVPNLPSLTAVARPLLTYQFEPKRLLESSSVAPAFALENSDPDGVKSYKNEKHQKYLEQIDAIRSTISFGDPNRAIDERDMIVVPLGTGAAIPAKYRNDSSFLFDAGENTLGQMYRHFGPDGLDNELRSLRCLFVSHLHADHHLGAISILKRIHEEYADVEDFGLANLLLFDSKDLMNAFESKRFSGDCRPSNTFVQIGKDSDLVIHEATLEDDKMAEALEKNHCTTGEAIDIGLRMNAKNLLLTHFSQRYPKLPKLSTEVLSTAGARMEGKMSIGVAFDSMRIRLSEFPQLEHLYGPLNTLWGDIVVVDEDAVPMGADIDAVIDG